MADINQWKTGDVISASRLNEMVNEINSLSKQDISNKADKSEIPTKTSQLQNDSNFALQPNFTFEINMIASDEQPSVTTTGVYPNLVITFNIPQGTSSGGGGEPVVDEQTENTGEPTVE